MADKNVLIVEDDVDLCQELVEILTGEGYFVKSASDPAQGKRIIGTEIFDIAILDYKLPGTSGIDLLKDIKKKNSKTDVFIISGRPFIEMLVHEEGASHLVKAIIKKPFDCKELLEKIKE